MENQAPSVLRGGIGGEPARKLGLAGPMASQVPRTPGLSSRTFGMGTPAAAAKTGGRMALGDISNMKKRAATPSQHGAAKPSNLDTAAVVASAAADLDFAEVDLPPMETAYPCEPTGPVMIDNSGLDVHAAVAALCQHRALTLGGTPYERRTHAHLILEQPPVLAEVPPSPAAGLAKRAAATRAQPPAVLDNEEDEVDDDDELETNAMSAQPQLDGDGGGEDGDSLEALEMQIDLSRLELVPSTPLAPEEAAEDEDAAAGEWCDPQRDGDEDVRMVSELEGASPLDLSGRLALLSMDMEQELANSTNKTRPSA